MVYEKLINELAAAKGRDFPVMIVEALTELFTDMGPKQAKRIVNEITLSDSAPSNIVGAVKRRWIEEKRLRDEKLEQREKWNAESKEACSKEEWKHFFHFLHLLSEAHRMRLVKTNEFGVTTPLSIDDYVSVGRPETWSPILDHFLIGYETAYKLDLSKPGAVKEFLERYNLQLKERFPNLI